MKGVCGMRKPRVNISMKIFQVLAVTLLLNFTALIKDMAICTNCNLPSIAV